MKTYFIFKDSTWPELEKALKVVYNTKVSNAQNMLTDIRNFLASWSGVTSLNVYNNNIPKQR